MTDPTPTPTIRELREGMTVTGFFAIRKRELKSYQDGFFLRWELGDASGRISAVYFQKNAQQLHKLIPVGGIVKVRGIVERYKDRYLSLKVEQARPAKPEEVDPEQFIGNSSRLSEDMLRELDQRIGDVTDPMLHELLTKLFEPAEFRAQLIQAPAGKLWHHAFMGGLLEHSLAVAQLALRVAPLYPDLNADLLLTGALIHDLGKIDEYRLTSFIDFSTEGRLIGHAVIAARRVERVIDQVPDFPETLRLKVIHLILAHHGSQSVGMKAVPTPGGSVVPMIPEAFVLHYLDEIDSQHQALVRIRARYREEEPDWTEYVNLIDRFIFLK